MRSQPLLLMVFLSTLVATATAAPIRVGSVTDACPVPTDLRDVHGSVVSSVGAADAGGVFVAASIQVIECDQNNALLVTSQGATFFALDPATGQERWRFATGGPRMTPPVLAAGRAYVVGNSFDNTDTLYAVDAVTGQEHWHVETGMTFSTPVVAEGMVYIESAGHLLALDGASGTEHWRRADVPTASTLAVDQGTVYAGFCSDDRAAWHLSAFDAATGADQWSVRIETAANCAVAGPTLADGMAYLVAMTSEGNPGDGYLAALDAATGAERWRWEFDPGGLAVTPVVHAGTIYVNGVTTLHAIDAADGAERWQVDIPWRMVGLTRAVAADGTVFVHADEGDPAALYALDNATGTERWRFPTKAPSTLSEPSRPLVAVAQGIAYVAAGETIYALEVRSGDERWRSLLALALPAVSPDGDVAERFGTLATAPRKSE